MIEKKDNNLDMNSNKSNQSDMKVESTDEQFNDQTKPPHKKHILTKSWTYGWVVAILTIFIAIFAFTPWNTLKIDMITGQRAWVIVKKAEYGPTDPRNDKVAAKLIFTNSGNPPALHFRVSCFSDIRKKPPNTVYDSITSTKNNTIIPIGPKETHSQLVEYKPTVDKGIWAGLHSSSIHFYIWGVAEYIDVFNEKRKTEFCYVSSKSTQTMMPCEGMNKIY